MRSAAWVVALGLLGAPVWGAQHVAKESEGGVDIEVEGTWEHPSGMAFPERVAGFRRVSVTRFPGSEDHYEAEPKARTHDGGQRPDPGPLSVNYGVGYELVEGLDKLASVTVYAYPHGGETLDGHFEQVVADVNESHSSAPRMVESTAIEQGGAMVNGRAAYWGYREQFGRRERDLDSRALLFRRGDWFVKVRATFPESERGRVEAQLDELFRSLAMPAG